METQNLTDHQLNVKVAEVMGWKVQCDGPPDCPMIGRHPRLHQADDDPVDLPKFSTSLDACATFEATITGKVEQSDYAEKVIQAVSDERHGQHRFIGTSDFYRITATPRQRCIAFLRMKGVL